jgi:hypothetical protein
MRLFKSGFGYGSNERNFVDLRLDDWDWELSVYNG